MANLDECRESKDRKEQINWTGVSNCDKSKAERRSMHMETRQMRDRREEPPKWRGSEQDKCVIRYAVKGLIWQSHSPLSQRAELRCRSVLPWECGRWYLGICWCCLPGCGWIFEPRHSPKCESVEENKKSRNKTDKHKTAWFMCWLKHVKIQQQQQKETWCCIQIQMDRLVKNSWTSRRKNNSYCY